jgi:hypothetical protein
MVIPGTQAPEDLHRPCLVLLATGAVLRAHTAWGMHAGAGARRSSSTAKGSHLRAALAARSRGRSLAKARQAVSAHSASEWLKLPCAVGAPAP